MIRRPSLDTFVNLLLIATCLVVVSTYASRWTSASAPPRLASPLASGRIPPGLSNVTWSNKNIVVFARSTCHFCTDSMPFYLALSKQAKMAGGRFVAVGEESVDVIRQYFQSHGVFPDDILSRPTQQTNVVVTPTLALLDSRGQTIESWVGKLPPDGETKVKALFASR